MKKIIYKNLATGILGKVPGLKLAEPVMDISILNSSKTAINNDGEPTGYSL